MSKDGNHYYDGPFFARFIDPVLQEVRAAVSEFVAEGSRVIDIGCGTGALAVELAGKCAAVTGLEMSPKMIAYANRTKRRLGLANLDFKHGDGARLPDIQDQSYDLATISLALHEMPSDQRKPVLREMGRIARRLIIADYAAPQPRSAAGLGVYLAELLAGPGHFRNFLDFQRGRGLESLLAESGLTETRRKIVRHGAVLVFEARLG